MSYRVLPAFGGDPRSISEVVNGLMQGRSNNTGQVELTTGTSTTLTDSRITEDSVIVLTPTSSSATSSAAYVSSRTGGQAVIGHASGGSGRTFAYAVIG
jgi:hypothetical protein